jgi:2-dehydropantoate 2-reductase
MRIGIIGGGSLGLLWAARLSGHADVTLFCKSKEQTELIRQYGIRLTALNGCETEYFVTAEWIDHFPHSADFDVLFLMTKQTALNQVLAAISSFIHENTYVVAWQNGLGHVEKLQACDFLNCYAVVTTEGARRKSANHVAHTGNGYIRIGSVSAYSENRLDPFFTVLMQTCGMELVDDIERCIWEKLAINVVINPLTAVLEVPNGKLLELGLQTTILQLIKELCMVADAKGFHLNRTEIYHQVKEVCSKTAKNMSSMLQDIQHKRSTEINSLNAAVVAYAEQLNLSVPTHSALVDMIIAKTMLYGHMV